MTCLREKRAALLALLFFIFLTSLPAQNSTPAGRTGDDLTLKVVVIGPGDELYFWWGHIGLVVEDASTGRDRFLDWGVFDFNSENFFTNFAMGRLIYSCVATPADLNYAIYTYFNRDITLYTLDLSADTKQEILRFAENNMLPQNRDYDYHHFDDNCATRIRDIIDMALDGKFKAEYGSMPGQFTLRQHVRRHTWFNPFFDWLLNFLMGQGIDRPLTVWNDMFLPSEIGRRICEFQYAGPDGTMRPLVSSVEIINRAIGRPAVLETPRLQWPRELSVSLLFSAIILLAFLRWRRRPGFRVFAGLLQSALGFFFGIAGSLLFFMTFFTDHDYTYHNINILYVNPLFLSAIPLGIIFAFTKIEKKRLAAVKFLRLLWSYVFLGGLLTMVIKLFPAFYQQNQVTQALLLPLAFAMVIIMAGLSGFSFFSLSSKS